MKQFLAFKHVFLLNHRVKLAQLQSNDLVSTNMVVLFYDFKPILESVLLPDLLDYVLYWQNLLLRLNKIKLLLLVESDEVVNPARGESLLENLFDWFLD